MAPKETKKDRERRLKKAEELTTDASPADGPTDDDEPDDDAIAYDGEGGLVKPSTSAAAAAAVAAGTITAVASTNLSSDLSDISATQGEKGSARARTGTDTMGTKAKRAASTRSTRPSKPKKSKRSKKERRRHRKRESSSSSSPDDRRRRRSPSSSSSSSSDSSGDSDWEDFYNNATVVAVRNLLKTAPLRAPRDVSKGRFSFEASGEVLFVRKADKGKKDKWMRESRSRRSDRYADYKGSISRLGHSGSDRVLQCNFGACVQPLMAIEKVLTTVPMGGSARKDLVQARRVLANRLYLLEVERETNPTVAAFVEAKRSKGDERDLAVAVDKYAKMKKSEKASSAAGAGGESARGGPRNRVGYNAAPRTPAFPVYLPTPTATPSMLGYQRQAPRPGVCFNCLEPGHRRGEAICKKKN
jgi:hypothetical protein